MVRCDVALIQARKGGASAKRQAWVAAAERSSRCLVAWGADGPENEADDTESENELTDKSPRIRGLGRSALGALRGSLGVNARGTAGEGGGGGQPAEDSARHGAD